MTIDSRFDIVKIAGHRVDCVIGVYEHERPRTQPLIVDVDLWLDVRTASLSDDVADTVDYAVVAADITRILVDGQFKLIEKAADAIAAHVLSEIPGPRIEQVRVKVSKPEAIAPAVAAVEILRAR